MRQVKLHIQAANKHIIIMIIMHNVCPLNLDLLKLVTQIIPDSLKRTDSKHSGIRLCLF